jgi:1-acyl-sn-glycerol-3-phosphate acyltransferase
VSTLVSLYMWGVGLLWLGLICIAALVTTAFLPHGAFDPLLKRMMRGLLRLLFIPVDVEGAEKLDPEGTYIFMSNHVSIFDVPLLAGFLPGSVRGIEEKGHFRWPLYGHVIRRMGNIPIDRGNVFSSMRSMRKAVGRLSRAQSIAVLPEGGRTTDGTLRPFKRLPFVMAKEAGKDIVPIGLSGLFGLKNKLSWRMKPVRVKIAFGEMVPAAQVRSLSVDELRELVRRRIEKLIERP